MKATPLDNPQYSLVKEALLKLPDLTKKKITIEQVEDRVYWSFDKYPDLVFQQITINSWRVLCTNKTIGLSRMINLIEEFA
jgi:hypothetical protein